MPHEHSKLAAIALPVLALAHLTGCGPMEDDAVYETHRYEIAGGQIDGDLHPNVVGIRIDRPNGSTGLCSGSLIAPNLVLTARHCVAEIDSPFVICGQTPFGATFPASSFRVTTDSQVGPQASFTMATSVHVPPGGDDLCGNDIALLILGDDIPSGEATPLVPRLDDAAVAEETYTAVGYGHIGNGTGAGTRRYLGDRIVECGNGACTGSNQVHDREFVGSDGTCQGDSGGAPIDEAGYVLGALSRGPSGCAGSVYSSVNAWEGWLREVASDAVQQGDYGPPSWLDGAGTPPEPPQPPEGEESEADEDETGPQSEAPEAGEPSDDVDGDTIANSADNCPDVANPSQTDTDQDGFGDACDLDDDNDRLLDGEDPCPLSAACGKEGRPTASPTPAPVSAPGETTPPSDPKEVHMTGQACSTAIGPVPATSGVLWLLGLVMLSRRRRP